MGINIQGKKEGLSTDAHVLTPRLFQAQQAQFTI
jgi:hypothetical protein